MTTIRIPIPGNPGLFRQVDEATGAPTSNGVETWKDIVDGLGFLAVPGGVAKYGVPAGTPVEKLVAYAELLLEELPNAETEKELAVVIAALPADYQEIVRRLAADARMSNAE